MPIRTILLIVVLIIVTGGLFALALQPEKKIQTTPLVVTTATPTPIAQTSLSLSPNPLIISSPSGSIDVLIETGQNNTTAIQLELSYDPKLITNIDLKPGTFFDNPSVLIKQINKQEGKITYAVGISPTGNPKKGQGIVAVITFQSVLQTSGQKTNIVLSPKSLVTAEGVATSVLNTTTGTDIMYILPTKTLLNQPNQIQNTTPIQ